MRKYSYSYSVGEPTKNEIVGAIKFSWDKVHDVMKYEDGTILYSYNDGRYYDDNGNHWQEIYCTDDEDLCTSIGFIQKEWSD